MSSARVELDPLPIDPSVRKILDNIGYYEPLFYEPYRERLLEFIDRISRLPQGETISAKAVALICEHSVISRYPFAVITHQPSHSMSEKAEILTQKRLEIQRQLGTDELNVLPLKTLTLRVEHQGNPRYLLVSGVGDFLIDGQAKKDLGPAIGRMLGTEANVMNRQLKINPLEFSALNLGVNPGIVSPFVERAGGLSGILYYKGMGIRGQVAIAVSLTDTLILDGSLFPGALNLWQGNYLNIPFRAVG